MIVRTYLALAVTALSLSGCASLQSNVRGNFACGAAEGTCAPTLTIDDAVLGTIGAAGGASAISRNEGGPGRKARIVFPAYTDAQGRFHSETAIYATLNDGLAGNERLAVVTPNAPYRPNLVELAQSGEPAAPTVVQPLDVPLTMAPAHETPNGAVINSPATFPLAPKGN